MKIDRLRPGEGGRLRGIRLRSLHDAPDAFGSTYEETDARPDESWRAQIEALATFVAVSDGRDVGIVRGSPFEGRPGAAILLSMWVDAAARGTGVGDGLIDAVIDWARSAGFDRIYLDVADDNEPAIGLYARKGFERTGATGSLPPPREHVREHEQVLKL